MQYGMIIDLNRCVGCHACTIACKAEWEVPADKGRNWVHRLGPSNTPEGLASTYYPGLCNHCNEPSCVPACPADTIEKTFKDAKTGKTKTMEVAATYKDPFNGTVQIDKDRCLGCGACADACPYGARYVNTDLVNEEIGGEGVADKCSYCMPRVEQGLDPACVQTCLANARIFGDLDDPNSEVAKYVKKGAVGLTSAAVNIGPNSRYYGNKKDMHLLTSTSTPMEMPSASLRRSLMARMKPGFNKAKNLGFLGLAGAVLVKGLSEDDQD
ncbi:MAG: 4Fe-4S dicluster domain-containing protein [Desulfobulbaceae bacterium]|nr:4Fe-4S dicluster domain-containing protein [Desulfobulbaceae bacterium]